MTKQRFRYIVFFLFLLPVSLFASDKIDTLFLQHGDRFTGEVKNMSENRLTLSTSDAGTIKVEWSKLDSVHILTSMRISLINGEVLYGVMLPCGRSKVTEIWHREGDPRLVELRDIVALQPVKEQIKERLNGDLQTGVSYVKANELFRINFDGTVGYTAEKNTVDLSYNALFSLDPNGETQRQNALVDFQRILPNNWILMAQFMLESNSELGVDLRSNFALGPGNYMIRNSTMHMVWILGANVNRENSAELVRNNLEAFGAINYSLFIFDDPDISFRFKVNALPSFTTLGRVRINAESSLKWELLNDFNLTWDFYFSYDNRPLQTDAALVDWSVTMLGLEFKF